MRRIFSIALLFVCAASAFSQVTVDSKIDSIQILIGEQTGLTLEVTARKGARVKLPDFKPSQYITPGVEVLEATAADTSEIDGGLVRITRRYTITSFDENLYYIPPMKVSVDGKTYKSRNLALKVLTVPVDTLHPEKFYPPKGVQDNPFDWSDWSASFWMSLVCVLAMLLAYYLWTRLKENKPVIVHVRIVKKVPPHQRALSEIERLKEERVTSSDDQKNYYTLLTDVIRKYIKERFGFNAMEMTSSEIIERLRNSGDESMVSELKDLFMTADLVKFAKYSTQINENDANLVNAIEFINTTKQDTQPTEEKVRPELSEQDKRSMKSRTALKTSIAICVILSAVLLAWVIYQIYTLI